jgi:hypothetical protein
VAAVTGYIESLLFRVFTSRHSRHLRSLSLTLFTFTYYWFFIFIWKNPFHLPHIYTKFYSLLLRGALKCLKRVFGEGRRSWTDRVKNWIIIIRSQEGKKLYTHTIKRSKDNWIGHVLRRNCLLQRVIEIKMEGNGIQGRRHKQLLNELKEVDRGNYIYIYIAPCK